jgi:magnesium chelatase family protein
VLFLDEIVEYKGSVLADLRRVLADGAVGLCRRGETVTYPANAAVIGAVTTTPEGLPAWSKARIPDWFDMQVTVRWGDPLDVTIGDSSETIRVRVTSARELQKVRNPEGVLNAKLSGKELLDMERQLGLSVDAAVLVTTSAGSVFRVARTIADLARSVCVLPEHLTEAVALQTAEGL